MARYGEFKYGEEVYGSGGSTNLVWAFQVDWTDSGLFGGENDGLKRLTKIDTIRGRKFFVKKNGNGFEEYKVGKATIVLDNFDDKYRPSNTSSPLFGNLDKGKFARLAVQNGDDGSEYEIFNGIIADIIPSGKSKGRWSKVTIKLVDGWQWLRTTISLAIQASIVSDVAIDDVLDAVSWPARWGRDVGVGAATLGFWFADGANAKKTINQLVQAELARGWVGSDGKFYFRSRNAGQATDLSITQAEILKNIIERVPFETVKNIVKVRAHPLKQQPTGTLWTLDEIPSVANGATFTVWAEHSFNNNQVPALNVITPATITDFAANDQSDGGGTDRTSDFAVQSISKFARTTKIVMINNGAGTAFLTLLKLRGDPISDENAAFQIGEAGDFATKPRTLTLDEPWNQDVDDAFQQATYLASILSTFDPFPIIEFINRPTFQYGTDLTGLVNLNIAEYGISANYRVGYIRHRSLHPNMQSVHSEMILEPFTSPEDYWTFPTTMGVKSIFAY